MIKFVRSDDQSDSCLGIILLQAVFHGAGAKCFTGDAGILKTAFKQLGNLMEKGIALLCCPEVNFIPLSKQGGTRGRLLPVQCVPSNSASGKHRGLFFGLVCRPYFAPPFCEASQRCRQLP